MENFQLSEKFIDKYKRKRPPFGFNGLGELVYMRTYSRIKDDGKNERWWETVKRVVEGTYSMQKTHIENSRLGWNAWQAQKSAQEMYDRIFMKNGKERVAKFIEINKNGGVIIKNKGAKSTFTLKAADVDSISLVSGECAYVDMVSYERVDPCYEKIICDRQGEVTILLYNIRGDEYGLTDDLYAHYDTTTCHKIVDYFSVMKYFTEKDIDEGRAGLDHSKQKRDQKADPKAMKEAMVSKYNKKKADAREAAAKAKKKKADTEYAKKFKQSVR